MLDDGDAQIGRDEFFRGIKSIKGASSAKDLFNLHRDVTKIMTQIRDVTAYARDVKQQQEQQQQQQQQQQQRRQQHRPDLSQEEEEQQHSRVATSPHDLTRVWQF
eukprot:NODE_14703_length_1092_cov_3.183420.p4 GENE.NODE_14703_length_1092_cov_3.183420~~NODE_14703_length_1092_cov_3.183420.p4  ORF type:complete len:105 (+),score=38.79 NODE_14703_length_1092_cov_3.183420:647-961(+)